MKEWKLISRGDPEVRGLLLYHCTRLEMNVYETKAVSFIDKGAEF